MNTNARVVGSRFSRRNPICVLPADGRNHKKTHRTEFNERIGRWICGCGWKSELVGKKRPKGNPGRSQISEEATDELPLFFTKCEYEHRKDSCVV